MPNIMHWLFPKEPRLFEMLAEQSENALEAAKELKNFIEEYPTFERNVRKQRALKIKSIEVKGDEIERKITEKLARAHAAPIDREDMRKMAELTDDVTDLINAAASGFIILGIERVDTHINKLADIALESVSEVNRNIAELKKLKHIKEHYIKIHNLERKADDTYHEALSELFHFYKNSIDIIKYKEIYEILEEVTNRCKQILNLAESIVLKHT